MLVWSPYSIGARLPVSDSCRSDLSTEDLCVVALLIVWIDTGTAHNDDRSMYVRLRDRRAAAKFGQVGITQIGVGGWVIVCMLRPIIELALELGLP